VRTKSRPVDASTAASLVDRGPRPVTSPRRLRLVMRVSIARHVAAVVVLPLTMAVVVPSWIAHGAAVSFATPRSPAGWAAFLASLPPLVGGLALFLTCLARFSRDGHGTLAPWDPPTALVVTGPYAYVRNPMISGVLLVLLGEGLLFRAPPLLEWAGAFFAINAVYIPLLEEPGLRRRFGTDYEEYRAAVPRLIPRLRPWRRPQTTRGGSG